MNHTTRFNYYKQMPPKGISWKAIFAGTVTTLSLMLILNLIGLAFGFFSIEPTEDGNPLSGIGTGAIIWWVVSNLIVLFAGGFVAARAGVSFQSTNGLIQGIMTWALYALFSVWMVTSAIGSIISGVGNAVGGVLSSTGSMVQDELAPVIKEQFEGLEISLVDARNEFYALLEDTDKKALDPENLEAKAQKSASDAQREVTGTNNQSGTANVDVERIFNKSKNRFEQSVEAIDKQALVNVLVNRTDLTENEARRTIDNTLAEFESASEDFNEFLQRSEEKAKETAENAAEAAGAASMYLAIALILGAIAAAIGGYFGVNQLRDEYIKQNYPEDNARLDYTDNLS